VPALRRSTDREVGYTRRRYGKGWRFLDHRGQPVTNPRVLERILALAIPPAWKDVWICRSSRGHLQATGIDAAGRKQYLYHPAWRLERDRAKHDRVLEFADALPALRQAVASHMGRRGLPREKALAAAVALLDNSWIRVGGERYAEENRTFGLATIRSRHVSVEDDLIVIDFEAKGGKRHHVEVEDRRLARLVQEMDQLPGYELLKYRDASGRLVDVRSADINAYIKEQMGEAYTAKDFRTWAGTVAAALALDARRDVPAGRKRERAVAAACREASEQLNNTPAVVRASYVDPRVIEHYMEGRTVSDIDPDALPVREGQSDDERAVLALLRTPLDAERALETAA
jgi:DNA topoisomerase I